MGYRKIFLFIYNINVLAGQERFRTICHSYYKDTCGIIYMYDITSEKTRNNISMWRNEAKEIIGQYNPENNDHVPFVVIANKMDLLKKNSENYDSIIKDSKNFTDSLKTDFIACSSKIKGDEYNVNIGMTILIRKILKGLKEGTLILPLKPVTHINLDDDKGLDEQNECICLI